MEEEEVVYLKIFDKKKGDVVFEGKVSTDVEPHELVFLGCFWERRLRVMCSKETKEKVTSFKGLQNNVELVAGGGRYKDFSGVLYVDADDGVLRKSKSAPLCDCVKMAVWNLRQEDCEKAFKCEMLEELEIFNCKLGQIPREIGKMKKLKKLILVGLKELKSIPEEMGELSSLKELWIEWCGIESLTKTLKDWRLKLISLVGVSKLQLNAEDLVAFSKLQHMTIQWCDNLFTPSFTQSFMDMIKSTTYLRVLELDWDDHNRKMVVAALEENGSIVEGGVDSERYARFFKRNKENHERARECVVYLLAIRRMRNALSTVPKEMVRMIATMLWMTRCDVGAWSKK